MIELDIKIRAKDEISLMSLISIMKESLKQTRDTADVTLTAVIDEDHITIVRKEIIPVK